MARAARQENIAAFAPGPPRSLPVGRRLPGSARFVGRMAMPG